MEKCVTVARSGQIRTYCTGQLVAQTVESVAELHWEILSGKTERAPFHYQEEGPFVELPNGELVAEDATGDVWKLRSDNSDDALEGGKQRSEHFFSPKKIN